MLRNERARADRSHETGHLACKRLDGWGHGSGSSRDAPLPPVNLASELIPDVMA
jgi:hypothetical protein